MRKTVLVLLLVFTSVAAAAFAWRGFNAGTQELPSDIPKTNEMPAPPEAKSASITFFGDIMLDRRVYRLTAASEDFGYPFKNIDDLFPLSDANIANLEGPVTSFESEAAKTNGMRFTFHSNFVPELSQRFTAFSLANNHTLDFGEEGLRQTKRNLSDGGIAFFGDYYNRGDNVSTTISVNGIKLGLVGYHALSERNFNNVILDIQKLKETSDFVVVMPHWGEEYKLLPSERQRSEAKLFIDAGADVVIGSHPHVIQPMEIYKDKAIFYSLGNFVFDQYFSEEVMRGLAVRLELKEVDGRYKPSYELILMQGDRLSQPSLMNPEVAGPLFERFAVNSSVSDAHKEEIRLFHRVTP